ncbi:nucleoside phosphorylase [Candidatus Bipolaricaulota sp. J31]
MKSGIQKHIRAAPGDVAEWVLLPGDPGRARRIAERFDERRLVAENREYVLFTGTYRGIPVSVCSTGIGGPSAAIALEELVRVGGKHFIRVGSCGGRQEHIPIGSLVVVTGAYRGEGTSQAYLPLGFPAVADLDITNGLVRAAESLGYEVFVGLGYTRDAYYVQDQELNRILKEAGVVAADNECSTLFVVGCFRRVRVGAVLATDSNIWLPEQPPLEEKERLFREGEKRAIEVALEAIRILAGKRA